MIKSKLNFFHRKFLKAYNCRKNSKTSEEKPKVVDNDFSYTEEHHVDKLGLLRAGILGANDGLYPIQNILTL
jgi:hypothetical protein